METRVSNKMKDDTKHPAEVESGQLSNPDSDKPLNFDVLTKKTNDKVQEKYLGEVEKQKYEQYKIAK